MMTNQNNTVLYTGVTGNLVGRIYHHKNKSVSSFSKKYNLDKLVYYEIYEDVNIAIEREKQIQRSQNFSNSTSNFKKVIII
jgi:putative endonuclease